MSTRATLAAGIVSDLILPGSRPDFDNVVELLKRELTPSAVWQSGHLPAELRGEIAYGNSLPRWRSVTLTRDQDRTLDSAWRKALPKRGKGMRDYLRLRVNGPAEFQSLLDIGAIDGMTVVPSLDSRGDERSFEWQWPLRVGVVPGPLADEWLMDVRNSSHLNVVFDAELFSPASAYDIVIVHADLLSTLSSEWMDLLGHVACVIVAGYGWAEEMLRELDWRLKPAIAVAFVGAPARWWRFFFHGLSHDLPVDVAVANVIHFQGVDAMMAGPKWGIDITASAHWFASVAPALPALEHVFHDGPWQWSSEGLGTTRGVHEVRHALLTGEEPRVVIPIRGQLISGPSPHYLDEPELSVTMPPAAEQLPTTVPPQPRRLVARVYDGESVVESVLPPNHALRLGVRIAIPQRGDVSADVSIPELFQETGPTVPLEVCVSSSVWPKQPPSQWISLPKDKKTEPSTWAVFDFTTPDAGAVVSIDIVVLHQGKPLQGATYESPVRAFGLPNEVATLRTSELPAPGDRPTLRTSSFSGPDEPTDDLKPVDVALDGRGADLRRVDGKGYPVFISNAQGMLDLIDQRVSKVLGVTGAPDSFDDSRALELLIDLARIGSDLSTFLDPLELGNAKSINLSVSRDSRIVPLELAYAAEPPDPKRAKLCRHVARSDPPPLGEACGRAGPRIVCPYAFWGLHRSIARTVCWESPRRSATAVPIVTASEFSILYAATVIADDGAAEPKPSDSVLAAAQEAFSLVTRVTSWTAWRRAVKDSRPNLLVVLGHTEVGKETRLYIGRNSAVSSTDISAALLRSADSPKPLVLLIACSTAVLGGPFGTLPGVLTAKGAGAVVGTLSKIVGPQGATATTHLLTSLHNAAGMESVGDAVARARYSLVTQKRPIGLLLVSHGELDTKAAY